MDMSRRFKLPIIACAVAISGCAATNPYNLPPPREDTIGRLAVDGQNAFINGVRVPNGSYVREGEKVVTGPATSVNLILNSGASIQLDQNTDPIFRLVRQGACALMELIRGQVAVATNNACVEFVTERLDTAGLAHSVINILAAESEVRVTVIEGEVQMSRPGARTVAPNQEYRSDGTRGEVQQLTPADAAASGAWTRNYFKQAASQQQSNWLTAAFAAVAIGLGAYFATHGGDSHPPASQGTAAGTRNTDTQQQYPLGTPTRP